MTGVYEEGSIKYWSSDIGGDYHLNFDGDVFLTYFENNVLPNLTKPSLIILDGASYHQTYDEGEFFPSKARKKELQEWLKKIGLIMKMVY